MEKSIINVNGMSCQHCVNAVTKALDKITGVFSVEVDLDAKTVTVQYDPALVVLDELCGKIREQGYDVI